MLDTSLTWQRNTWEKCKGEKKTLSLLFLKTDYKTWNYLNESRRFSYLSPGISARARGCSRMEALTRVRLRSPSGFETWARSCYCLTHHCTQCITNIIVLTVCHIFLYNLPQSSESRHQPSREVDWQDRMSEPRRSADLSEQSPPDQNCRLNTASIEMQRDTALIRVARSPAHECEFIWALFNL